MIFLKIFYAFCILFIGESMFMKKWIKCAIIVLLLLSLAGCRKETTQIEFMEFSEKCRAQEYYQTFSEFLGDVSTSFYYNHENGILFETYTMVEKCKCDTETFNFIKNKIETGFNIYEIVLDYTINDIDYDVFIVENENRLHGEFQEFGFVAFNEKNHYIDIYWFYNQDYDMSIYDATSFDEFYKSSFSWLKTN